MLAAGQAGAGPKAAENRALLQLLDTELVDLKDFQNPVTLKEALGMLMEQVQAKGKRQLVVLVNGEAFKKEGGDASVADTQIQFAPFPKQLAVGRVLELMVSRVKPGAAFVVRNGMVEITTSRQARTKCLLQERVTAHFQQTPFSEAVDELSALTGASIVLDIRLGDKLNVPVTASLRNDVTLKCALRMLADMANLKIVFLPSAIYITDPRNAQNMQKELEAEQGERERRKQAGAPKKNASYQTPSERSK
jgi:hypothetical protein